jgi:hypothetical protein
MDRELDPSDDQRFLLDFFKALAEPARLRIAARLAAGPATVPELTAALNLPARACTRDLTQLVELGLVRADPERRPPVYTLDEAWLRGRRRGLLDSPRSRALAGATDDRSRVLAAFFRDGRLLAIPTGDPRKQIVLGEVARLFDATRAYTEREVSALLKDVYAYDFVTLRRLLVDFHYLNRDNGVYWVGEGRRDPAVTPLPAASQR